VSWSEVVASAERIVGHKIETRSVEPGESIEGLRRASRVALRDGDV